MSKPSAHFAALAFIVISGIAVDGLAGETQSRIRRLKVVNATITGTVSFHGYLQSFTDYSTGDLAIRDLRRSQVRYITKASASEGADASAISHDGKQVAYTWFNDRGGTELRVLSLDGSEPRILHSGEGLEYIEPQDWSPDGKYILASFWKEDWSSEIVVVSLPDGSVRGLKSFDFRPWGRRMCFSPDGRFVAYDTPQDPHTSDRDVFLLPATGGPEIPVIRHPANDLVFGWLPDGSELLFTSNRSGTWDLWRVRVSEGKATGDPVLAEAGIGPLPRGVDFSQDNSYIRGLGFTADGKFYYGFSNWENNAYVAVLDPETGKLRKPRKIASHLGFDTPVDWSPDGRSLAYVSWPGWELYSFLLRIRSVDTGEEHRHALKVTRSLGYAFRPRWSPDGEFLLAQGGDGGIQRGIFRVKAATGEVEPVLLGRNCPPECMEWPTWSSRESIVFARWTAETSPGARIIVTHDLRTGRQSVLSQAPAQAKVSHLVVSPNGKQLGFVLADLRTGTRSLNLVPTGGGEARELVSAQAPETIQDWAWTPDGAYILFGTGTTGVFGKDAITSPQRFKMWRVSVSDGKQDELGLEMQGRTLYGLSVHPDGRRVAFAAGTPLRGELWVLENLLPASKHPSQKHSAPVTRRTANTLRQNLLAFTIAFAAGTPSAPTSGYRRTSCLRPSLSSERRDLCLPALPKRWEH